MDDRELLLAQFDNSVDLEVEEGTETAPFFEIDISIPMSVSIADVLTPEQIERYYDEEVSKKRELNYIGYSSFRLQILVDVCNDLIKKNEGTKASKKIAVPDLQITHAPCEIIRSGYTLYSSSEGLAFTECTYNVDQQYCPRELDHCKHHYGFCPRNPDHHNIEDKSKPRKTFDSSTLMRALADAIRKSAFCRYKRPVVGGTVAKQSISELTDSEQS